MRPLGCKSAAARHPRHRAGSRKSPHGAICKADDTPGHDQESRGGAVSDAGTQQDKATLTIGDKTAEFPLLRGTDGAPSVDISTFTRQTGHTDARLRLRQHGGDQVRDHVHRRRPGHPALPRLPDRAARDRTAPTSRSPGCSSTASCPRADELAAFDERIRRHTLLHEDLKRFFSALPHTAHPMSVLSSAVSALSTYYENESDPNNPEHVELNTIRMLAKLPVIAAYAHKKSIGQAFLYPDNSLSFVDNFLKLNFGVLVRAVRGQPGACRARSSAC